MSHTSSVYLTHPSTLYTIPESPTYCASPEALSDYRSDSTSYFTPQESHFDGQEHGHDNLAEQVSALVAEFYHELAVQDAAAAANTAQGEFSKLVSRRNAESYFVSTTESENSVNVDGFSGGQVVCHVIDWNTEGAKKRQRRRDQAFKLQPAPLWTKRGTSSSKTVIPFKEIQVGASWAGRDGAVERELMPPQPTAKVSAYLDSIPGTSSAFPNLFDEDAILYVMSPDPSPYIFGSTCDSYSWNSGPKLSSLDSFSPHFDFKGFESDQIFEVLDLRIRAYLLVRDLADVLDRLTQRYHGEH